MECTKRDLKRIDDALDIARTSTYGTNIKIGAVLVTKCGSIFSGANIKKSSPMQYRYNKLRFGMEIHDTVGHAQHAEMSAIKKAIKKRVDLNRATLYVARIGNSRSVYGMCRPCKACLGAAAAVGITDIFFTTTQGIAHERVHSD